MMFTKKLINISSEFSRISLILGLLALSSACHSEVNTKDLTQGLTSPWGMAALPNGDLLVTERAGIIRFVRNGKLLDQTISGVPAVYEAGQGGLMDIKLDSDFEQNNKIYLSYAHGNAGANATRLASAKLLDNTLTDLRVLFTGTLRSTAYHYGARIIELNDDTLMMSVGDGYRYLQKAQALDNYHGKIIRIDKSGKAPSDNPFINNANALPEIYSYGHRNPQGLVVIDLGDQGEVIIEHEHGPKGGDEVNWIRPAMNYGWPKITYGIDYSGTRISDHTELDGMEQPGVNWTPSIAPSGMVFYQNDQYPEWHNSLFVTSLSERSIRRVTFSDGQFTDHGIVFSELGKQRYRDIEIGIDGALYLLTDGTPAQVVRIPPPR